MKMMNPLYERVNQKVLWAGSEQMVGDKYIDLSEPVAEQPNGIVLVWGRQIDGIEVNSNFNCYFVPKDFIKEFNLCGHEVFMANTSLGYVSVKYVYIGNTRIKGHDDNTNTGTGKSGITYNNAAYILRRVIGV